MAFPQNMIGVVAATAGGAYLGYQAEPSLVGGMGFAAVSAMQWFIGIALIVVGLFFAVFRS